jgi:hypothetical protein
VRELLGHWVGEAEGEPVSERLPLGEREGLRVAHTVGVCVLHTVPLSVARALEERDRVLVRLREGVAEMLPEAVAAAGELEGEAVPAAAPIVALGLAVSHPLLDRERVWVEDAKPEAVKLTLEKDELLAEAHCVLDCVAHWVTVGLELLLRLRVPEAEAQEVPRKPSAAAPPEALGLSV